MKVLISHSLIITLSFLTVFIWQKSELTTHTATALGIITSLYLILALKKSKGQKFKHITVFLLITASLLLIQATGSLHSPLFFLFYFLSFYIGFTLQAETVLLFTTAVIFFFLQEALKGNSLLNMTHLASFLLLSPLGYFFGKLIGLREKELKQAQSIKEEMKDKTERIIENIDIVINNERDSLKKEDLAKLHEVVEESVRLKEEAA